MKKKILCLGIIVIFMLMIVILTGCGNSEKVENSNENTKQEEIVDKNIIGTWFLNRNIKVSENKYNSLKSLIGDSYGSDTLEINEDGTFSLKTKGEYIGTYENNKKEIIEIALENNGILYLKSNNKKCQIEIKESNSVGRNFYNFNYNVNYSNRMWK